MRFIKGPGAPSDHRKCREKTRKKGNPDYPACVHQQRRPGQLGIEIFGPNAENDPDRVSIPLFERRVRNGL